MKVVAQSECIRLNTIHIWTHTMVISRFWKRIVKDKKIGHQFSKIVSGGFSWCLAPTEDLFSARGKEKNFEHHDLGHGKSSIGCNLFWQCDEPPIVRVAFFGRALQLSTCFSYLLRSHTSLSYCLQPQRNSAWPSVTKLLTQIICTSECVIKFSSKEMWV